MESNISTYEQQALDFLNATNTSFSIYHKKYGVHFAGDTQARHIFRVTLKNDIHRYSFDFGQSIAAGSTPPNAYDVLACLTKYDPESFEDFCASYGYEQYNDYGRTNKVALRVYNAVVKEFENVCLLWDDVQIEQLQEIN
jgi:hypothetical protein